MGYSIFNKSEVWSDLCADLYEDAIQDRWNSSTDIPWEAMEPLSGDVERAICQIATLVSEYGWAKAARRPVAGCRRSPTDSSRSSCSSAPWCSDSARLYEVWRKRALSNGGGLGRGGRNWKMLPLVQSYTFSEFAIASLMHDAMLLSLLRAGEDLSQERGGAGRSSGCA